MQLGLQHSYATLPPRFWATARPAAVPEPRLVVLNRPLAQELGLDPGAVTDHAAALFSGNELPEDAQPIAMAYAGHQFGAFVPSLGDGRAILLGELRDRQGVLRDLQLKGAGTTPWSRNGDGRAVLGPMLREYLISEAMHALGIPSTRSLAVVATGEHVFRDRLLPGAVLTRVASSHVRVGTFQYFAARGDEAGLRALLDYVIARHDPQAGTAASPALAVLTAVSARQAQLLASWMCVGFIHGVMNTDNMTISGETIDYGPCAFMDEYDPRTVFSSIDHGGRYAYINQPAIAQWNLARLAETLLPLIDPDVDRAVASATAVVQAFAPQFDAAFLAGMRRKLGLTIAQDEDAALVRDLLAALQGAGADFTLSFRRLAEAASAGSERDDALLLLFPQPDAMRAWLVRWRERLAREPQISPQQRAAAMRQANPAFIPRNHRVQAALDAAEAGDEAPFHELLAVLQQPYADQPARAHYGTPPQPQERVLRTFCGT